MKKTLIEEFVSTDEEMRLFQQEKLILECTELICELMDKRGINKAELAKRLGKTKGYITQLLDGRANMTLRTISDVMWTLDASLALNAGSLTIETSRESQNSDVFSFVIEITFETQQEPQSTFKFTPERPAHCPDKSFRKAQRLAV